MRILNRPMFRYGGPINEGVMHGMRSNYAGGQRVGSGLVGHPAYPKTDGREHHVLPIWAGAAGLARMAPMLYRAITGAKNVSKAANITKNLSGTVGAGGAGTGGWTGSKALTVIPQVSRSGKVINKIKDWFKADPLYSSVAGGTTMLGRGIKAGGQKIGQFAKYSTTTPSGLLFFGAPVTIAGTKWLLSDGTELDDNQKKQVTQVAGDKWDPGAGADQYDPSTSPSAMAEAAKKARKAKLEKYLDTMGYDKAKKTAMGDALIDASAIVQDATTEAGSLKKADWGKMINKAIQTTSKRLDKPEQIREAVGLMMTKAGIEKDMNADKDALDKLAKTLQIKGYQKTLAGSTLAEDIAESFVRNQKLPSGATLAGLARTKGIDAIVLPTTDIPKDMSAIDYITIKIKENADKGTPLPPGNYVVKDRLLQVDETGTITDLINQ